jgi:hypothetical protein
MFCEYCGQEYEPGEKVCKRCGNALPEQAGKVESQPVSTPQAGGITYKVQVPSQKVFIKWGPVAQDLLVYGAEGQSLARITKAIGPNGFEIQVQGTGNDIDLIVRQTTYTLFDVIQRGQLIARIEERLVVGQIKLTSMMCDELLLTEHEKFATRKSFYAKSIGEDKVADIRAAKPEEMPGNMNPAFTFMLDVKKMGVNFLYLLGIVLQVLFRYR